MIDQVVWKPVENCFLSLASQVEPTMPPIHHISLMTSAGELPMDTQDIPGHSQQFRVIGPVAVHCEGPRIKMLGPQGTYSVVLRKL